MEYGNVQKKGEYQEKVKRIDILGNYMREKIRIMMRNNGVKVKVRE